MKPMIYADYAATAPLRPQALAAMEPYFHQAFGNPGGLYAFGQQAKTDLEAARQAIATCLGAQSDELFFTSGGTESDNWALRGVAQLKKSGHIITTAMEHHAILHTAKFLERQGFTVTYLPVDSQGVVNPDHVKAALRPDTILISVMAANNEVGSIQPIAQIGAVAKEAGVLFHVDAVQAVGHIPVDVKAWNCDLLSFSGHKFGGPRGMGGLYMRKGLRLPPLIIGGGQESGRRSGTQNVMGAVGMATALTQAVAEMDEENARLQHFGTQLQAAFATIPYGKLTGHPTERLAGINSFVFEGVEGESLLLMLDKQGICTSSGSACSSTSLDPSHVLLAMGLPHEVAHGSLRISLGTNTTQEEVDAILAALPKAVDYLRNLSPVWDEINQKPVWYGA